jgi:hypothetical protein
MYVKRLNEAICKSETATDCKLYFYMTKLPDYGTDRIYNHIYISQKDKDYKSAATYLSAFDIPIVCYELCGDEHIIKAVRQWLEEYRYQNHENYSEEAFEQYFYRMLGDG